MIAPLNDRFTVGFTRLPKLANLSKTILPAPAQRNHKPARHQHALWRRQADPSPEVPSVGASGWQLIDRRDWDQDDPAFAAKQTSRLPVSPSPLLNRSFST